jgi:hypothetical protein
MNFKILKREKFKPLMLFVGDSLKLLIKITDETTGKILHKSECDPIIATRVITFNETIIFETEFEGRKSYGAMALEAK